MPTRTVRILGLATLLTVFASPAAAGWREDMGTFRIGVVAGNAAGKTAGGYEALRATLSGALAMPVDVFVARDYPSLIDAHASGRIEYAVYTGPAYAAAWLLCKCVEPVVAPVAQDGETGLRALVIGRADLAGTKADLSGSLVVAGPSLALDLLYPRGDDLAIALGLAEGSIDIAVMPSAEAAAQAFADGKAPALLAWDAASGQAENRVLERLATRMPKKKPAQLSVLWRSVTIPFGPHAIRSNLPGEAREVLRHTLPNLVASAPAAYDALDRLHGGGMKLAIHADYLSLIGLLERLREPPE